MTDQPLHLLYRPSTFDEFIGNDSVVDSLKSVLGRKEGRPHSFLFTGPSGCGKTTLARIIRSEIGCSDRAFKEYNASNVRGIDTIREIAQSAGYAPLEGNVKCYLLDEVHKLTNEAMNASLKLLEDTPPHVYFILCTTEPEKLIKTIRNRCTEYRVSTLPKRKIVDLLRTICDKEKVKGFPEKALIDIANVSEGCPRRALVILDSVIDIEDDGKLLQAIQDHTVQQENVRDLCRALLEKRKWEEIAGILKGVDEEPETVRYAVLGYMNSILLGGTSDRAALVIEQFLEPFIYTGKAGLTYACYLVWVS